MVGYLTDNSFKTPGKCATRLQIILHVYIGQITLVQHIQNDHPKDFLKSALPAGINGKVNSQQQLHYV